MKRGLLSIFNSFLFLVILVALAPLLSLALIHPITPVLVLVLESLALLVLGLRCQVRFRALFGFSKREQANLGALAEGVADLRCRLDDVWGLLESERRNLGKVADAVHDLRLQMSSGADIGDMGDRLDRLDERVTEQSKNLGMVAGGLDTLRHAGAGVDLVQGRYAALSDSIIDIAAHVDVLSRTVLAREADRPPRRHIDR